VNAGHRQGGPATAAGWCTAKRAYRKSMNCASRSQPADRDPGQPSVPSSASRVPGPRAGSCGPRENGAGSDRGTGATSVPRSRPESADRHSGWPGAEGPYAEPLPHPEMTARTAGPAAVRTPRCSGRHWRQARGSSRRRSFRHPGPARPRRAGSCPAETLHPTLAAGIDGAADRFAPSIAIRIRTSRALCRQRESGPPRGSTEPHRSRVESRWPAHNMRRPRQDASAL
jgi:hypothetical protein